MVTKQDENCTYKHSYVGKTLKLITAKKKLWNERTPDKAAGTCSINILVKREKSATRA